LRTVLAAERKALAALPNDDPLAAELRGSIGRAQRALDSIAVDPLRSGTMSPTMTVVPATRRVLTEARALVDQICA
jgi:hypothetical protein